MIQVKIHDTIVDIIEKIEAQPKGDIILDIPLGHPILHNYLSLKILKSKVGENRKLIIATSDRIGKKIGKSLGIEYSLIKDKKFLEKRENSQSLLHHNYTFWEYFKFQIRSYLQEIKGALDTNKKLNSLGKYSRMYQEKTPMHMFIGFLLLSIILFIFIYYFAVSKTYIYITPEIIIKKEAHNFVFKENIENSLLENDKNINVVEFSQKLYTSDSYPATEITQNSSQVSHGSIRIFNLNNYDVDLVKKTRFQSENGIVYRATTSVKVPAAITDNFGTTQPGTQDIEVEADLKDAEGNFSGTRGDIGADLPLFLPGLDDAARENIYAKTISEFTGGVDTFQKVVSESDIENARKIFEEKLKNDALEGLKKQINTYNEINKTHKEILTGPNSRNYIDTQITIQNDIEPGSQVDEFQLTGSTTLVAYVYDTDDIIQRLKTRINERYLEGVEKISQIERDSLRVSNILYSNEDPFEQKATFEIESRFLHDFLHKENTYINYLKSQIRGLPEQEAEKILLNDPNISNVDIRIRPFFVNVVSNIPNNIIFKIQ